VALQQLAGIAHQLGGTTRALAAHQAVAVGAEVSN